MTDKNVYAPPLAELEKSEEKTVDYVLASRWQRLFASLIDGVIALIFIFPVIFYSGYWDKAMANNVPPSDTILLAAFGLLLFSVLHGYLLAKHGQTIGKKLLGIKMVSVDSDEILPLWKIVFLRYLPISIASNTPLIGQFLVLIDTLFIFRKNKRCVHDLIAGTKVVTTGVN